MADWFRFWDFTTAEWAGLQFLVLLVAAVVASWQVWEARRVRVAQARPFVVVDFEVEPGPQTIHLVISNIGTTMARDVRLAFDPELSSSLDSRSSVTPPRELKPLREGIPSLPPGKRLPILLDTFTQRKPEAFPDEFRVHVSFYAPALKRRLCEEFVLDLGLYRNALHLKLHDLHDVHERLKDLVTETRKWTAQGRGILMLDPAQVRARTADTLDYHRAEGPLPKRLFYRSRIRVRRLLR